MRRQPGFPSDERLVARLNVVLGWGERALIRCIADYARWFHRASGDVVSIVFHDYKKCELTPQIAKRLAKRNRLQVGDLVVELNGYRNVNGQSGCDLASHKSDGVYLRRVWYGSVPRCVSMLIENPVSFYKPVFEERDGLDDFHSVELDAWAHQGLLRAMAGDRAVSLRREFALHNRNTSQPTVWMNGPSGPDVDREIEYVDGVKIEPSCRYVRLDASTPDEYLSDVERLQVDPIVEKERKFFQQLYEVEAHKLFREKKPGDMISTRRRPRVGQYNGAEYSTPFVRCDIDPFDQARVLAVHTADGSVYMPQVLMDRGPFRNIRLWVTQPQITASHPRPEPHFIQLHMPSPPYAS